MFWLRNKKNIFLIHTLNLRTASVKTLDRLGLSDSLLSTQPTWLAFSQGCLFIKVINCHIHFNNALILNKRVTKDMDYFPESWFRRWY